MFYVDLVGQLEPVLCCLSLLYAVQTCLLLTVMRLEDWNLVSFCIDGAIAKEPTLAEELNLDPTGTVKSAPAKYIIFASRRILFASGRDFIRTHPGILLTIG